MPEATASTETIRLLQGKRILLGVTGSIASYKAVELASLLTKSGAEVDVVLSPAAKQFISELTFRSVTGRKVYTDSDLWGDEGHVVHVGLAKAADLVVVAPATANTIAKLAGGFADGLIPLAALATEAPLLLAPAMDAGMYDHAAVQENIDLLRTRGVVLAGPAHGRMASGLEGWGRLLEPEQLLGHIRMVLGGTGALAGRKLVVTAGGTEEPIDPVRSLTNRSSGKQGYALAQAAIDRGGRVVLITAPTSLQEPIGARRLNVRTAAEMHAAVEAELDDADALMMAAAVSDFRPAHAAEEKLKKEAGPPQIQLEPTIDILAAVGDARRESGKPTVLVGFAAESHSLTENAVGKLKDKGLDLIVANDITAPDSGFGVDTNRVVLVAPQAEPEALPLMSKSAVAEHVLDRVAQLLEAG